jgi:hypothetical protein
LARNDEGASGGSNPSVSGFGNGLEMDVSVDAQEVVVVRGAAGQIIYDGLTSWIQSHIRPWPSETRR